MEDIVGSWTLESRDDNFDQFLQCRQASWFMRTVMQKFSADVEYTLSDDKKIFTKKTISSVKTSVYPMKVDEVFIPEKTLSGKPEYGTITETSCRKVIQEMRFKENDNVAAVIEREVRDNKLNVKLKCKDIICNEVYKRKDSK